MRLGRWALVFIVGLCTAALVRADEPEIFTGYGKTRWGQSIEEVRAIYPQMTEVSRYRELKKVPLDTSADEDASGYPVDRFFSSPAQEPLREMVFGFTDGRLNIVEIAFSAQVSEKLDDLALAQMVWDKYFATEESRSQLARRDFKLHVVSRKGGNYITDRPKQVEQLLQPNMYQYGEFDLGMYYEDGATQSRAFDAAGARAKAVKDQRQRETKKAADELGIRDML